MDIGEPCKHCGWFGPGWVIRLVAPMVGFFITSMECPMCRNQQNIRTREEVRDD